MADDPLSDPEERRVLSAALDSYRQYRQTAHFHVTHLRRQSFYSLPFAHVDILCEPPFSFPDKFRKIDDAIDANAEIAEAIVEIGAPAFGLDDTEWHDQTRPNDNSKAQSTIKQIYRDWSAEGEPERKACFGPILDALARHCSHARDQYRVLVPGAGLGRLVFDICHAGYTVEGNEISYHQLLASNFLLNYTKHAGQFKLYPWALSFSNHVRQSDQLLQVAIPDIHPGEVAATCEDFGSRMSMSAGDFTVVYRTPDSKDYFDAVATCFFIDTAPNLIHYIETVRHCLKPNGVWINLGPLLWHFESSPTDKKQTSDFEGIGEPGSFELANDEVLALLQRFDFEIIEQKEMPGGATGYMQDPRSMLQNIYKPVFWVARKTSSQAG